MKTRSSLIRSVAPLLLVILVVGACRPPALNPTVAASGTSCSYAGPKRVFRELTLTWDVKPSTPAMDYGFLVVALADGKTDADIKALPNFDPDRPPTWMNKVGADMLVSSIRTDTFNLDANAAYHGEPLYVMCFSHGALFEVIGPIEVQY